MALIAQHSHVVGESDNVAASGIADATAGCSARSAMNYMCQPGDD